MNAEPLPRPVLLYDGECRFCRFAARFVVRLDRQQELAFLSLQDERAAPLLVALPASQRLATWRLARPAGALSGYGAGIRDLLETMQLARSARRLLSRVPDSVLDVMYGVVARNRGTLGRLVPDGPAPERYP
jgi:predicted DCC family thiol-disulfide oxidoreductase YuxK